MHRPDLHADIIEKASIGSWTPRHTASGRRPREEDEKNPIRLDRPKQGLLDAYIRHWSSLIRNYRYTTGGRPIE
jgi:hypothetical protein